MPLEEPLLTLALVEDAGDDDAGDDDDAGALLEEVTVPVLVTVHGQFVMVNVVGAVTV